MGKENLIYSVVVLFKPDSGINDRLKLISEQSDFVHIIVNESNEHYLTLNNYNNSSILFLNKNLGLAKALNIGIKNCLMDSKCSYVVLFDQDSTPDSKMIENMISNLDKCDDNVVAVSPQIIDIKNTIKSNTNNLHNIDVVITSGSLYPRNTFEKIGLMDETFFIDYIDYEWCLRAKSKNYKIKKVNDAFLFHNMGDTFINFFGISKPIHSNKIRSYYIIRNQLIFISRGYIPIKYRFIHLIKLFYRIPAYIFFSNEKKSTLQYIFKALSDYFKNRKKYLEIKY